MQDVKVRDFQKLLRDNGFHEVRSKGSHVVYERTQSLSIPVAKTELNGCMAKRLIKEFALN